MELNITTSKTYRDIDESKKICILQGGTRSSKSYSALQWILVHCLMEPNIVVSVVRKSFPSMRVSIMRDWQTILKDLEIWDDNNWSATEHIYTFDNGSMVEFMSIDSSEKRKGSARDYLFIDECNELSREDYFQLFIRTRKKTIIAYNPSFGTNHYIFNEIQTHPESSLYVSTFLDNPFLEKSIIDEIERLKYVNPEYYKIYGLGLPGNNVGTIFSAELVDVIPDEAEFVAFGMDFGFSIDPTTLVAVYKWRENLYFEELLYKKGLVTSEIVAELNQLDVERNPIWGDSAEGRLIEEIYRAGYNIKPVKKGKDSIKMGIDIMHQHKLHILKSSVNIVREFSEYVWTVNKNGDFENIPVDYSNHAIDAIRYVCMEQLNQKKIQAGKYAISIGRHKY
jgi:phage terminase large subunit